MTQNLKALAWREAATGGFYLGVLYAILEIAGFLLRTHTSIAALINMLHFFALGGFLYFFTQRMVRHRGPLGMSFGQCWGFTLRMSLFTGILAGVGLFILFRWIDPTSWQQQMEQASSTLVQNGWDQAQVESAQGLTQALIRNPLFLILGGIFQLELYGGIIGLLIAFFTRRPPHLNTPSDTL
ncbi:MAG: DUF4199 domain-containing protein [Alistipes sp.]|nr:DUF4199 domain-containing protein [Alistipes sp.]